LVYTVIIPVHFLFCSIYRYTFKKCPGNITIMGFFKTYIIMKNISVYISIDFATDINWYTF
jgi:hypothetical protein